MSKFLSMLMSWKTTVIGVVGAAYVVVEQLRNLLDDNPATVCSVDLLWLGGIMALIGLFARDSDKSSEDVGVQ